MTFATSLTGLTDIQLLETLAYKDFGGKNYDLVKFELERRVTVAQVQAAEATLRGAIAAERYTQATWVLILVTICGAAISSLK